MTKRSRDSDGSEERDIIFCGNPGVGKSTLLTAISGTIFQSGLSYGEGKTVVLRFQDDANDPNLRYADTPGLADVKLAENAAKAINKALVDAAKRGRRVQIVFVVTAEAGRVRPSDHMTINKVMGSITLKNGAKLPINSHGVIVNKCTFLEKKSFHKRGLAKLQAIFATKSETNKFPTAFLHFLPRVEKLEDEDNAKHDFEGLKDWVGLIPGVCGIDSVSAIDVRNMEKQLEDLAESHKKDTEALEKKLKEENEELKAEMEQTKRKMTEAFQKQQRALEDRLKREQQNALGEATRMHERQLRLMEARQKKEAEDAAKVLNEKLRKLEKSSSEYKRIAERAKQSRLEVEKRSLVEKRRMDEINKRKFDELQRRIQQKNDEAKRNLRTVQNKAKPGFWKSLGRGILKGMTFGLL